jgi:PilZ domain
MEHRCGSRYSADIGVYVSARAGTLSSAGRLCDVSISGGFIVTALPIEPLNMISLQFSAGFPIARLQAQVIRRTADGVAVEWQEYAPGLIHEVLRAQPPLEQTAPSRAVRVG